MTEIQAKCFNLPKNLQKKKWFSTCIITERGGGIFTFFAISTTRIHTFTGLHDKNEFFCLHTLLRIIISIDPCLYFLSWNSFTNMMKNWHERVEESASSRRVFIRNAINHLERCYARSFRLIITFCFFLPNHQFSRFPIRIREQHSMFTVFLSKIQI